MMDNDGDKGRMPGKHSSRMRRLSVFADPKLSERFTPEVELLMKTPGFKKHMNKIQMKALAAIEAQSLNGAGFALDSTLRFFLREYNNRLFKLGFNSMPSSFNVLEAFFEYRPDRGIFRLRGERDHLFTINDFVERITSPDFSIQIREGIELLEEGVVYSYNNVGALDSFTFSAGSSRKWVVGGISLVRYASEVNILFLAGEELDGSLASEYEFVTDQDFPFKDATQPVAGREGIKPANDWKRDFVRLLGDSRFWQALVLTRFDLNDSTQNARYILRDCGDSYLVTTDNITAFLDDKGELSDATLKEAYKKGLAEMGKYNSLIEIAQSLLLLPAYFLDSCDSVTNEYHTTEYYSTMKKGAWVRKRALLDPADMIAGRSVSVVKGERIGGPDRTFFRPPHFKVDISGYWKRLRPGHIGADKHGREVHGRTWVEKSLTWVEVNQGVDLVVGEISSSSQVQRGDDAGTIYVMRSAAHERNVFKIGLTRRSPEIRAKELGLSTSSPTEFLVVQDWDVSNCEKAEKLIHEVLDQYRINPRREYFRAPYKVIRGAIESVIKHMESERGE